MNHTASCYGKLNGLVSKYHTGEKRQLYGHLPPSGVGGGSAACHGVRGATRARNGGDEDYVHSAMLSDEELPK